jgi:hypothetical protein
VAVVVVATQTGRIEHRSLNIPGQQQHCWPSRACGDDRAGQRGEDVGRFIDPFTEHRHCAEHGFRPQRVGGSEGIAGGRRLTDQGEHRHPAGQRLRQARNDVQRGPTGTRHHHTEAGAAAAVPGCHCGRGELVLGRHRGDFSTEVCGIEQILDVGAVDAEDMAHPAAGQVSKDMVRNADAC